MAAGNLGNNGGSREHGLNVLSAAVFVAGEMAGSGVLALPKAMIDSDGKKKSVDFCGE